MVEFSNPASARRAIAELDGSILHEQAIRVREDRLIEDRPVREQLKPAAVAAPRERVRKAAPDLGRKSFDKSDAMADPHRVFISSLGYDAKPEALSHFLSALGQVVSCDMPVMRKTGRNLGHAIVEFADSKSAATAIERWNGLEFEGRALTIRAFFNK